MDTLFLYLKKFLVLTVVTVFAFVMIYIPHPTSHYDNVPVAEAALPTVDFANIVQTTATALKTYGIFSKEFLLDGIAWGLAKSVISSMTASTIRWINSGFEGSPAFVQDLDRFLLDVADATAGVYLQELGEVGTFLCSPFQLDIQIALALQYKTAREGRPYEGCRVSETFQNFESFIAGNFSDGGWQDWITITAEPERYTEFGQLLAAESSFNSRLLQAQNSEARVLDFGNGFLSQKVCDTVEGYSGTTTANCKIVTPGQTISDSLSKVLGSGQDALITADEIDEIIGALVGQLAVKAITGTAGLLGLSVNTGYTYGGFDSGDYLGDLELQSLGGTSASLAQAAANMEASLQIQQRLQTTAQSYSTQFDVALRNTPTDETERRDLLQTGKADTLGVLIELSLDIPELQKLVSDYRALDAQLVNTGLSTSARQSILDSQKTIINKFISGDYFTDADARSKEALWRSYLQA